MSTGGLLALADHLHDLLAHRVEVDAQSLQGSCGHSFAFADEAEQDVLGADVAVIQQARLFLGQNNDSASPVGEPLKQGRCLLLHSFSPLKPWRGDLG